MDGPDFVILSGPECDFQHWYYCKAALWIDRVAPNLQAQIGTVRKHLPKVLAISLHLMFHSTYKEFTQATADSYNQYNALMAHVVPANADDGVCPSLVLLDLPTLMNYSTTTGDCVGGYGDANGMCEWHALTSS